MTRPAIPPAILEAGALAILRGVEPAAAPELVDAIRAGGIEAVEVTLDSPSALEVIARLDGLVGAGTVLDVESAERALGAGARFLVAPDCRPELVGWAAERGVPILPGAFTPTEIRNAWLAGAAGVKLFPADALGPGYIRALGRPLAGIPLIPTGGVDGPGAQAWRDAGAVAVAVGSWLTDAADAATVTRRAASLCRGR